MPLRRLPGMNRHLHQLSEAPSLEASVRRSADRRSLPVNARGGASFFSARGKTPAMQRRYSSSPASSSKQPDSRRSPPGQMIARQPGSATTCLRSMDVGLVISPSQCRQYDRVRIKLLQLRRFSTWKPRILSALSIEPVKPDKCPPHQMPDREARPS